MDIGIVSMRYAKALMQYAINTRSEEAFYAEMQMLHRSFIAHPDLKALENPLLSADDKYRLLCVATVGEGEVRQELGRFYTLVMKNGREEMLPYICLAYADLYRKHRHIGVARLTTAVPVTDGQIERIRGIASRVLHAQMEIETTVDPSLEGGFVFDINNFRLDASIATCLKKVKQQFIDRNRRIV